LFLLALALMAVPGLMTVWPLSNATSRRLISKTPFAREEVK
jgi:hypothetical protein